MTSGQWWGMLGDVCWMEEEAQLEWSILDMLALKHSSSIISIFTADGGQMILQNASSMDLYGCHERDLGISPRFNFIDLIFGSDDGIESLRPLMISTTAKGETFRATIEIKHPTLRSLINLTEKEEMHLDCQVSESTDPKSFKKALILSQVGTYGRSGLIDRP